MPPASARACGPVARKPSAISKLKLRNTRPSCARITNGGANAPSPAPKRSRDSASAPLRCLPRSRGNALNLELSPKGLFEKSFRQLLQRHALRTRLGDETGFNFWIQLNPNDHRNAPLSSRLNVFGSKY